MNLYDSSALIVLSNVIFDTNELFVTSTDNADSTHSHLYVLSVLT
jgi:hypothetical protein